MDTFTLITGLIGLLLLTLSLVIIIASIVNTIKRKKKIKHLITSIIIFLILFGFATGFINLALFLQTFSRYTKVEKIGWVVAEETDSRINMTYHEEKTDNIHYFDISGDQWMVEGYFLRWSTALRWLGAGSYYRVTRFTGRWEDTEEKITSVYKIHPETNMWKFLLKYGEKIPFVDAAYGIGAFQYPDKDTFEIFINDTGFILKKR